MAQVEQRLIARYGTLSLLGSGGMGAVYRVHDAARGGEVAIKTVAVADPRLRARLRREAELLARLSHPHVCPILEWQEEDDGAWIVMPVLDGTTLDRCARDLTVDTIVELLQQAARGVAAAHVAGLVHRDLKPANLMVLDAGGSQPRAVVMDFGIAHASDASTLTGTHEVLGTPAYMAPEQARGESAQVDARADVWGLGATLYDALTGRPPHGHGSLAEVLARVLDEDVASPRVHRPTLPEPLARICLKALERDPARRYPSADAFADDLQRYLRGARVRAPTPGPLYQLRRMLTRHPRFWAAVGALSLALLLATGAAIWSRIDAGVQAAAAAERAALVERVRAGMRAARLAPAHPIERERAPLLADIEALAARQAGASGATRIELERALAQAWFELGDAQRARAPAAALLEGEPAPSHRELYARIELALYAQAAAGIADLPPGPRAAALQELQARHLQPALQALAPLPAPPALLQAELALAERRFEDADAALADIRVEDPSDERPALLAGDLASARALAAAERGERAVALQQLEAAAAHYRAALEIVRSDPHALARACEVAARRQSLLGAQASTDPGQAAEIDPACASLTRVDGDGALAAQTFAAAWLALARAAQQANQPARAREHLAQAIAAAERAQAVPGSEAPLLLANALQRDAALLPDDYAGRKARLDRAIGVLESARAAAPGALALRIALGEALRDRGRLLQNHRQLQADAEGPALLDDYRAARAVLEQALVLRADSLPARRALALTLMFHFYALRDEDPAQARSLAQAALASLEPALAAQPDDPDLLFDQAANLGDLWTFESGYTEPGGRRATLPLLERAWPLFERLRAVAPARVDGYDYEIAFRAQAGERLREAGEKRLDQLAPLPALVDAARAADVELSEHFLGWALTEYALALADESPDDAAVEAALAAALAELERGLADPHRRYDSVRMLLQWSGARAERLPAGDPTRAAILDRAESMFAEAVAGERGQGDNILWCEGGRIAFERRRHADPDAATRLALERFQRCEALGPMWFRAWQPYVLRLRKAR
ncbi:MAG: serine/threonine protein kinase [Rhodanobacteraceae bacterium]|nr:serine/threonine protein kinase [Rhodanobacteraceae bacterium]